MKKLLEQAFKEAARLDEEDQAAFAAFVLEELKQEKNWKASLKDSKEQLSSLAREALSEYEKGNTIELDPDNL